VLAVGANTLTCVRPPPKPLAGPLTRPRAPPRTAPRRKQGLARRLMALLEETTEKVHDAWFVDLFVRVSNQVGSPQPQPETPTPGGRPGHSAAPRAGPATAGRVRADPSPRKRWRSKCTRALATACIEEC
jgi:hypothetical protein